MVLRHRQSSPSILFAGCRSRQQPVDCVSQGGKLFHSPPVRLVLVDGLTVQHGLSNGYGLRNRLLKLGHYRIVALVDEATGYQYARARDALEKILERYISEHLVKWAKRFPDDFYEEMFRLKGWDYLDPIKSRPGVVGKYTNDIVYERLAPGVLEELQRLNPPTDKGYRKTRHHQWLTTDVGHPALRDHLMGVVALMKATPNGGWAQFKRMLTRVYPKCSEQIELALER